MKTHINQIFTIVGFFSMSLITTLTISWGITGALKPDSPNNLCENIGNNSKQIVVKSPDSCKKVDLNSTFKTLIPKILLSSNR